MRYRGVKKNTSGGVLGVKVGSGERKKNEGIGSRTRLDSNMGRLGGVKGG
jgi:hypothetical protein